MLWEALLSGVKKRCVSINIESLEKERGHKEGSNLFALIKNLKNLNQTLIFNVNQS